MVAPSLVTVVDHYCTMKCRLSPTQKGQKSSLGLFKKAMVTGYGEEEFAALIKVLRRGA
jgi:hypothetical protein